jgi:hypothetical protein
VRDDTRVVKARKREILSMPLSDEEFEIVERLSLPLPKSERLGFIEAVEVALSAYPTRGGGLAHRIARSLQREYLGGPPRITTPQLWRKASPVIVDK